jgi:hypothetical protein
LQLRQAVEALLRRDGPGPAPVWDDSILGYESVIGDDRDACEVLASMKLEKVAISMSSDHPRDGVQRTVEKARERAAVD